MNPSAHPEQFPTQADQDAERQRLFQLLEKLIKWENSNDEKTLAQARAEIQKSAGDTLPPFLDPFAGGGSIPLEAQRLGLETHASDLNPVAVLIEKALIEIPPKFANRPPVSFQGDQLFKNQPNDWKGAHGLAEDIRYYGKWMRDEAEKRIGHLYPKATLPDGSEATVIAWLWVRTVICPNPACGARMPLASKWWLSKKKGKEAWAEPVVDQLQKNIKFEVRNGQLTADHKKTIENGSCVTNSQGKKTKAAFECIFCKSGIVKGGYINEEANNGRMSALPIASIYSRYSQVIESDGTPLRVRTALQMINQELDAALTEQEGEYDRETRWAIAWFEQYGMQEGEYGVAETLSKAKNMSVAHLENIKLVTC